MSSPFNTHIRFEEASPDAQSLVVASDAKSLGEPSFSGVTAYLRGVGSTGGTTNVGIWTSYDGGATWWEWFRSADIVATTAFFLSATSHNGAGAAVVRGFWNGTGTPVPLLTKGNVAPGMPGNRFRLVFETGAGVSAGDDQIVDINAHRA